MLVNQNDPKGTAVSFLQLPIRSCIGLDLCKDMTQGGTEYNVKHTPLTVRLKCLIPLQNQSKGNGQNIS